MRGLSQVARGALGLALGLPFLFRFPALLEFFHGLAGFVRLLVGRSRFSFFEQRSGERARPVILRVAGLPLRVLAQALAVERAPRGLGRCRSGRCRRTSRQLSVKSRARACRHRNKSSLFLFFRRARSNCHVENGFRVAFGVAPEVKQALQLK